MKHTLIFLLTICGLVGYSQEGYISFEEALQTAHSENKPVMMVFSGSDWCKPCMELKKNIIDTPEFNLVEDEVVFLYLDFPFKKANRLSKKITQRNEALAEKYNPQGQFPKTIVVNELGQVIFELQYEKGMSKEVFINNIKKAI